MSVGFPLCLRLDEFGLKIWEAFGEVAYHVGSSFHQKTGWRDVDVRLILLDEDYEKMGFGDPNMPQQNAKWCSLCEAYSVYGKFLTNLPIDFQIQQMTWANQNFPGANNRNPIGIIRQISLGIVK